MLVSDAGGGCALQACVSGLVLCASIILDTMCPLRSPQHCWCLMLRKPSRLRASNPGLTTLECVEALGARATLFAYFVVTFHVQANCPTSGIFLVGNKVSAGPGTAPLPCFCR